jgi:chromosome segregation ATPase
MSEPSYRDLYDEVATLRQEMAAAEADVRRLVGQLAEANGRLIEAREHRDRWRRMHHEVEVERGKLAAKVDYLDREVRFWKEQRDLAANVAAGIADLDEVAPALRKVLRTERERRKRSEDENDRLAYAATRVVQLVTHGADGLVVGEAIAAMRRVLDGGGQ